MPRIRPCQNHADCKGFATDGGKLCRPCQDAWNEHHNRKENAMSAEKVNQEIVHLHRSGWLHSDPDKVRKIANRLQDEYSAWDEAADLRKHAAELDRLREVKA